MASPRTPTRFYSSVPDDDEPLAFTAGNCTSFCGPSEQQLRQQAGLLSMCEGKDWPLVACYARSAAGTTLREDDVRTPETLAAVVQHLMIRVLSRRDVELEQKYAFVSDRLRATRKESAAQRVASEAWFRCTVAMVCFHATMAYALAGVRIAAGNDDDGAWFGRAGGRPQADSSYEDAVNDQRLTDCLGVALGVGHAVSSSMSSGHTGHGPSQATSPTRSPNGKPAGRVAPEAALCTKLRVSTLLCFCSCMQLVLALGSTASTSEATSSAVRLAGMLQRQVRQAERTLGLHGQEDTEPTTDTAGSGVLDVDAVIDLQVASAHARDMCGAYATCLAMAGAWHAGHHFGVLQGIDQLLAVQTQAVNTGSRVPSLLRLALRCAAHGHVPVVRARLLASLCAAMIPQRSPDLAVVARLLHMRGHDGPGDDTDHAEPAWYTAARMCCQLQVKLQGPLPSTGGAATAPATGPWTSKQIIPKLLEWREARRAAVSARPPSSGADAPGSGTRGHAADSTGIIADADLQGVVVAFDKLAGATLDAALLPNVALPLRLRIALTPVREDGAVPFPSIDLLAAMFKDLLAVDGV